MNPFTTNRWTPSPWNACSPLWSDINDHFLYCTILFISLHHTFSSSTDLNVNLQLSLIAEWWLSYVGFHCLLFIDFKLKWLMAHCLHMLMCMLEYDWATFYRKSKKLAFKVFLEGSSYEQHIPWANFTEMQKSIGLNKRTIKKKTSKIVHQETYSLSTLQFCNSFFHFVWL